MRCETTLDEACELIVDCPHNTAKSSPEIYAFAVGTKAVSNGRINLAQARPVDEATYRTWIKRGAPRAGDLILCREAPVGPVARVPSAPLVCLGQRTVMLRPNPAVVDGDYLLYALLSPQSQRALLTRAEGSTVVHLNVADVRRFPVSLPPLNVQRSSASILRALDDKIDSNRQLARLLEQAATELFRARFVDFVGVAEFEESEVGRIPAGWQPGRLGALVVQHRERCRPSEATTALPYVPIDAIPARSLMLDEQRPGDEAQSSLTTFEPGDILFGAMRPYFHKVAIAPFHGTTRTTVFVLRPLRTQDWAYTALLLSQPTTVEFATRTSRGSTIPYAVWEGVLSEMPVIIPPVSERAAFDGVVRPLLALIQNLGFEQRALAGIRDLLLPKLISGQIRVPDAADPGEVVEPVAEAITEAAP
jgi:type I restriction enzyme S subunit